MPRPWAASTRFDIWNQQTDTVQRAVDANTAAAAAGISIDEMRALLSARSYVDSSDGSVRVTGHFSISG